MITENLWKGPFVYSGHKFMATALLRSACRRRIPQKLHRFHSRHYGAIVGPREMEVRAAYHKINSRNHDTSSGGGILRNIWKDFKKPGLQTETSTGIGLAEGFSVIRAKDSHHAERIVLELSQLGRQTLLDIRQTLRAAGDSLISARADIKLRRQTAWKLLGEQAYVDTRQRGSLPHFEKVLKAASTICVRHQLVPRTLALVLGNATLIHHSVAETVSFPGVNGQQKEGIRPQVFLLSALFSLIEGLILIVRAAYLAAIFSPVIVMAPFVDVMGGQFREMWFQLVHHTLELAGAAFIKWGQWAATRPDLFPRDLCYHLSKLHSKSPAHNFAQTQRTIEGAFGRKLDEIFEDFEEVPMASGSIGQVHKAVVRFRHPGQKSKPLIVAVKVRHPGVVELIRRDFTIMNQVAKLSNHVPGLSWLRLDETVQQFASLMLSQVDLAREAAQLSRFNYNFRKWKDVSFPKPLYPLVHPEVLVETFEPGKSIAHYIDLQETTPLNKGLADIGTNALLKMLLVDNFIHADMHPGNILVQAKEGTGKRFFKSRPHVILLDVGMTVELSQKDQQTLLLFFKGIATKKGRTVAECALQFSRAQNCPDPDSFKDAVENVFDDWSREEGDGLHAGDCIQELLEQVRVHKVNLDGNICSVIVTTLVLEGWQRKLDPELNMINTLQSLLFQSDWASSISYTMDSLMGP